VDRPGPYRFVALFVLAFLAYALTAAYATVSLDVQSANRASWITATTGAPWTEDIALPELDDNPLREVWLREAPNGHEVIGRSPGVVAAAMPAYWAADQLGLDRFSLAPGALTAAALTAGSLVFLALALEPVAGRRRALLTAVAFGFTTPVWSIAANGVWPHTITVFGITGMAWAASSRRWWLVGLFGGITLWGRLHAAVIVAALGLFLAWRRRDPRIALKTGSVSLVFLALLAWWTRWMYGTWDPTASYDTSVFADYAETHRLSVVNQLGMWISPDRGVLVWTPVVLLLTPALVRSWRELPDWSKALLVAGLGYTLLQAFLNRFSGGDTFYGYRLGLEFLACATPALALALPRATTWERRVLGPLLGLQAAAIMVGATSDRFFVSTDRVWTTNAFAEAVLANPEILIPFCLAAMVLGGLAARALTVRSDDGGPGRGGSTPRPRQDQLPLGAERPRGHGGAATEVAEPAPDRLDHSQPTFGRGQLEPSRGDAGSLISD